MSMDNPQSVSGMTDLTAPVLEALGTVIDPDLKKDLVTLNMIRDLEIVAGHTAKFTLVLTTKACPLKAEIEDNCRAACLGVDGIEHVDMTTTAETPKPFGGEKEILTGVSHIIAISSGKGGVGKSTVTTNLACALAASGARVGLMDADIYGPSIPTMMGIQQQPFVENKKMIPIKAHGIHLMSIGFLVDDKQAMIWRGPMLQGAVRQFLTDVEWGELDYLLIDLPPGTGDVQLTITQNVPLSGAVVVTTPQNVALADARRGVALFEKMETKVLGIIENMSHYICPSCGHQDAIFGVGGGERFSTESDVPFLGQIPLEPAVREAGDDGTPVVIAAPDSASAKAFMALAGAVAQQASIEALS